MADSELILDAILEESLEEIRDFVPSGSFLVFGPTTLLFGEDGLLDSLSLVHLIVAIEDCVARKLNRKISLTDPHAFSESKSPFRTLQSLRAFLGEQLNAGA